MTYQNNPMPAWAWREAYSAAGLRYWRYDVPMPRIHNYIRDCVVYLYPSEDQAAQGEKIGGSGFLIQSRLACDPQSAVMFAVTNKHVIDKGATVIRLNRKDGRIAVAPYPKDRWITHPVGDDLAIVPITLEDHHQFSSIGREHFINQSVIDKYDIGIGDDVFVVGRFINHEGKQRNEPSLRFGNIAQMPGEKILQDTGFEQESFLVEAKSIGGYSGSPVFVHILGLSSRPDRQRPQKMLIVPAPGIGPWLLGVDWGHLNLSEYVMDRGVRLPQNWHVPSNTGMMGVVPAWKLEEMFQIDKVTTLLKQAEDFRRREMERAVGTTDIASQPDDASKVRDGMLRAMLSQPKKPRKKHAQKPVKRK